MRLAGWFGSHGSEKKEGECRKEEGEGLGGGRSRQVRFRFVSPSHAKISPNEKVVESWVVISKGVEKVAGVENLEPKKEEMQGAIY